MSRKSAMEYLCNPDISSILRKKFDDSEVEYRSTTKSARSRIDNEPLAQCLLGKKSKNNSSRNLSSKNDIEFSKITAIALDDDKILNHELASIMSNQLHIKYEGTEVAFTGISNRVTDIVLKDADKEYRIEVMWRKTTTVGEIANYTLKKIQNYAEVIGILK